MPPAAQHSEAVLDYASPRQRGKLRLPSQSVLAVSQDRDGVNVVETLSGQRDAIVAIAGTAFAFVMLIAVYVAEFTPAFGRMRSIDPLLTFCIAFVVLSGVVVALLVINNTWRRTVLRVHADEVVLEFSSPFGRRIYRWPAEQIENVRVERTSEAVHTLLAELQLHPTGSPVVHLFTDHPERELAPLGKAVGDTLGFVPRGRAAPDSTFSDG